jgi:hypothetical protein
MHGHTPAVAGAVTAQPIHMIYQENVADNRMKGMTYATLRAPLTRPAFDSAFTEFPPSWMADMPPRPFFRVAVLGPKYLLIVAFRVDDVWRSEAHDLAARDPQR